MQNWNWSHLRARCIVEARRFTPSAAEAEDVVQEALVRAWRNGARCRSADPLPWLLTITRREAFRERSRPREELREDLEHEAYSEEVHRIDERLDVAALLASLRPEDRRLLELRYRDDLTQAAVARALGLPEGTTKVRLHRLRAQLRDALNASDD